MLRTRFRTMGVCGPAIALVAASAPDLALAQKAGAISVERFLRGVELVDAAYAALGGSRFDALTTLHLRLEGANLGRFQSVSPTSAYHRGRLERDFWYDLADERLVMEQEYGFPGGIVFHTRFVIEGDSAFSMDHDRRRVRRLGPSVAGNVDFPYRTLPHFLVQKARERRATVRWLGPEDVDGRRHDAVAFEWGNGTVYTLIIDEETKLPRGVQWLVPDPIAGDAAAQFWFEEYATLDSLRFPRRIRYTFDGDPALEAAALLEPNAPFPDELVIAPSDYSAPVSGPPEVRRIAEGLYVVERLGAGPTGSYRVLLADLGTSVAVVDAPLGSPLGQLIVSKIQETIPGKPISHVVLTHYHADHTAGVRPFVAEGASIVTTAGNRDFVERLLSARSSLSPDGLWPQQANFTLVADQLTLGEGTHRLEIHQIGPTPHVDDMFVVYHPASRTLFQSDLVIDGKPWAEVTSFFSQWLSGFNEPVDLIIGNHAEDRTAREIARK